MMSSTLPLPNGMTSRSLDWESLNSRCFGRVDLVRRVLEVFHSSVEQDIALLEAAIAAKNWRQAAQLAHRVKGSSLSVSASQLADFSLQLERCAMSVAAGLAPDEPAELLALEALLAEVRLEYESVGEAIDTLTGGNQRGQ